MRYTPENATDLMHASCGFYRPDASYQQVPSSLKTSDLLQVDETTCIKPACSSQLAASLLTTCNAS